MAKKAKIRVGIVGASGLVGGALIRLLSRHPFVELAEPASDHAAGQAIGEALPALRGVVCGKFTELNVERLKKMDVVFLCKKAADSLKLAPEFAAAGARVIDVGAEFRFRDAAVYEKYYGEKHTAPALAKAAVYGLTELKRDKIRKARVIGNPGCYPTAAIIALFPILKAKLAKPGSIVVDAYSGLSGAGAQYTGNNLFIEVNGNVAAYKALSHRHRPEMEEELRELTGQRVNISFIPHLIPVTDGIYASIILDAAKGATAEKVAKAFRDCYGGEKFIRVLNDVSKVALKNVIGTNFADVAAILDPATGKLIVKAALDNTIKGAVGQAVQNMNVMFGLPEAMGIV